MSRNWYTLDALHSVSWIHRSSKGDERFCNLSINSKKRLGDISDLCQIWHYNDVRFCRCNHIGKSYFNVNSCFYRTRPVVAQVFLPNVFFPLLGSFLRISESINQFTLRGILFNRTVYYCLRSTIGTVIPLNI